VTSHEAWGLGSYSFFDTNPAVVVSRGFEVPDTPGVRLHHLVTVSLGGVGTIAHIVNDTGARSDAAHQINYLADYPSHSGREEPRGTSTVR
jgi:hypothetical protein